MSLNITTLIAFACVALSAVIGLMFAIATTYHANHTSHATNYFTCTDPYMSVVHWSVCTGIVGMFSTAVCQFAIAVRSFHTVPLIREEEFVLIVRNEQGVFQWIMLVVAFSLLNFVIVKAISAPKKCRQMHLVQSSRSST